MDQNLQATPPFSTDIRPPRPRRIKLWHIAAIGGLLLGILIILMSLGGGDREENRSEEKTQEKKPALSSPNAGASARSYRMGFSILLPHVANRDAILSQKIALMAQRADADVEHIDIPWGALLRGTPPETLAGNLLPPITLARSKGMKIFIMLEPVDGLDRSREAPELIAAGKSIKSPAVQKLYRDYARAVARAIKPEFLGLAAEVNAIQTMNPDVYSSLMKMAQDAASDLDSLNPRPQLYVSAAADVAWGSIDPERRFLGIADTFRDFPFIQAISLTVYPQQRYDTPEDIPDDYLTRLTAASHVPVLIDESGWPSRSWQKQSSLEMQTRWIRRLGALADSVQAQLVASLEFTDGDCSGRCDDVQFFISQGMVTTNLSEKPALAEWDALFRKKLEIAGDGR